MACYFLFLLENTYSTLCVRVGPKNAEQKHSLFSLETHREDIYQGLIGYNKES